MDNEEYIAISLVFANEETHIYALVRPVHSKYLSTMMLCLLAAILFQKLSCWLLFLFEIQQHQQSQQRQQTQVECGAKVLT